MKKRMLSLILTACMLLGMLPGTAGATGTAWDGTATESVTADSEGVYTITNGAQLAWVAAQVNAGTNNFNGKTIKLGDNIDLASKQWTPIGNSNKYFYGTFDGMGHTVANLTITGEADQQGLFGYAQPMNIRNLGVVSCAVTGGDAVGAIVGELKSGNLYNCYSTGTVTGSNNSSIGGIVGNNSSAGGNIKNCYSTATVGISSGASSSYVGGIAGDTRPQVAGYYLTGSAAVGVGGSSVNTDKIRAFTGDTLTDEIAVYSLGENTKPPTNSLLQALNNGVDNYFYFTWVEDSENVNGGYPVFGPKYEPPHTHGVDGKSGSQTYTAWTSKTALPTDAGSYYLKEDVTLPADWTLGLKTINLCLNGHTINTGANKLSLLGSQSDNSATVLNLCDCQTAGTITGGTKINGEGIAVQIGYGEASPTFNMYGGKITGSDRGVALSSSGFDSPPVFNMYGGTISGNTTGIEYGSGTVNLDGTVALKDNTGADIEYRSDYINDIRPITLGTRFSTTTTIGVIAGNQTNGEPLTGALTKAFGSNVSSKFTYAGEHPLLTIANGASNAVQLKFRESWTDEDNYDAVLYATAAGNWQIADAEDFGAFAKKLNEDEATFKDFTVTLTGNIDLTGKLWNPIKNFEGTFDGGGHTISGLEAAAYSTRNEVYSGLFATLSDATAGVRNLTVSGTSTALSTRSTAYAGGIVAGMYGKSAATPAFLENCVSNVVVTATSPGNAYAGGIAGYHTNSRMINCVNNGAVTANAGSAENTDCTANAGGLAGYSIWSGDDGPVCINNSYNTGAVTAKATTKDSSSAAYAGGIVGGLDSDNLRNCYNVGAVSATADTKVAGGVVGKKVSGEITSCYYLAASETDSESGTTFQTSDAMKAADFVSALNGWVTANTTDFSDAMHWKQETGQNSGYPILTAPPVADPEAEWTPTGGTKTTGTFAEALAAMGTNGGSIKLLKDVSTADVVTLPAATIALDLDSKTWTAGAKVTVQSGCDLTVTGNSAGKLLVTVPAFTSSVLVASGGAMTMTGGNIVAKPEITTAVMVETSAEFTFTGGSIDSNAGDGVGNRGTFTMSAPATITAGKLAIRNNGGKVYLSGGTVQSGESNSAVENNATLYLSGAPTLTPSNGRKQINNGASALIVANDGASTPVPFTGTATVSCSFSTEVGHTVISGLTDAEHAATFTVSGPGDPLTTAYDDNAKAIKTVYKTYTITYKNGGNGADFNGTHGENHPTTHTYNTATTLVDATRTGYTFDGWFTDKPCTTGKKVTTLAATAYKTDITLYAKWTQNVTPAKPVLTVETYTALSSTKPRIALFANGRAVTTAEGENISGQTYTKLYYTDDNTKTTIDLSALTRPSGVTFIGNTTQGYDLTKVWLYGGSNGKKVTGNTEITVTGGMVGTVVGGGRGGDVSGTSTITVTATTATTKYFYVGAANGGKIEGGAFFSSATSAAYSIQGYAIDNGTEAAKTDFTVKLGGNSRVGVQDGTTNNGGVRVSGQNDTRGIDIKTVQIDPAWAANDSNAYILFDVASVFKDGDVVATGTVGADANKYKATTCLDYLGDPTKLQNSTEIKGNTVVVNLGKADPPGHVPVTGITGVPTAATAGEDLALSGTVAPANATNKAIVWSVKTAGDTGATITGSTLKTTAAGTVTVTATIANGQTASTPFTKDFTITVTTKSVLHVHDGMTFEPFPKSLIDGVNYIYFQDNVIGNLNFGKEKTVNLCLNGHSITAGHTFDGTIVVEGTLNIYDCNGSNGSHLITVNGTEHTITGGLVTGGSPVRGGGGGVSITAGGAMTLYGGTIAGNTVNNSAGGGVYVLGTFTMEGGAISYNTVTNGNGGGLCVGATTNTSDGSTTAVGTAILNGGTISHNTASGNGGGVRIVSAKLGDRYATLTLSGTMFANNTAGAENGVHSGGQVILDADCGSQSITWQGAPITLNAPLNAGTRIALDANGAAADTVLVTGVTTQAQADLFMISNLASGVERFYEANAIKTRSIPTSDISGSVTDDGETPVPVSGVDVKLMKGGTGGSQVGSTVTTDGTGNFKFEGVPYGSYSLVASKDGKTITRALAVIAQSTSAVIVMPSGNKNTKVEVTPGTPSAAADKLEEMFTPADTEAAKTGNVEIKLVVDKKTADDVAADAAKITSALNEHQEVGAYLDAKLLKTITGTGSNVTDELIQPPAGKTVRIVIDLPVELQNRAGYVVVRVHNDVAATLAAEYDKALQTLTFEADAFSTYAVAYSVDAPTPPPVDTGSGVTTYAITATALEGGSISPKGTVYVNRNGSKTFTITPNEGYEAADVLVDGVSVGRVTTYTFEKVTAKHTIEASFRKEVKNPFTDVTEDDWFHDAVLDVLDKGLMEGTGDGKFSPYLNTDRATVVTVLWRMEGMPSGGESAAFPDVPADAWYAKAVAWAHKTGVVKGYDTGKFGPTDPITREQLVTILWRYAGSPLRLDYEGLTRFEDTERISQYAAYAVTWAAAEGILTGKDGVTLDPTGTATRAEVATMLMRFAANIEK